MNRRLVLIDSSVWINHWTAEKTGGSKPVVELLLSKRAATNEVVRMEILTGAKDENQYEELLRLWEGLYFLPVTAPVWRRAESLRFELRRKGNLLPLPDVLIASCAIESNCELLHADKHYDHIAKISPLKIFRS